MFTLADVLADLDDVKSRLYELVEAGLLDENINDQAQELMRESYSMLEETLDDN